MAKYVLNSGGFRSTGDEGVAFYAEVLKDLGSNPKVLICAFADIREKWDEKFHKASVHMTRLAPEGIIPICTRADEYNFEQQVLESDVVFFYGGDVEIITHRLKKYNIPEIFKEKVIAGSSAGAAVWATYYLSSERRRPLPALGVLPIKFIPHYGSTFIGEYDERPLIDWEVSYRELENIGEVEQKIYAMPEGEFTVIISD